MLLTPQHRARYGFEREPELSWSYGKSVTAVPPAATSAKLIAISLEPRAASRSTQIWSGQLSRETNTAGGRSWSLTT